MYDVIPCTCYALLKQDYYYKATENDWKIFLGKHAPMVQEDFLYLYDGNN